MVLCFSCPWEACFGVFPLPTMENENEYELGNLGGDMHPGWGRTPSSMMLIFRTVFLPHMNHRLRFNNRVGCVTTYPCQNH